MQQERYFRKGFKMRGQIQHLLDRDYRSEIVDEIRRRGNVLRAGDLTLRLADEFGFCYGVDRAVDYAFQTREKFPDRRIFLTGDMIHNASMNARLREMGIEFLSRGFDGRPDERFDDLGEEDVVILPAFGAPVEWVKKLRERGCIIVDTTCGSVLSVWKRVTRYAQKGFTSVIHGKYYHEETKATASQTRRDGGNGKYLIVRDLRETGYLTDFIRGRIGAEELKKRLGHGMSPGLDPERDLVHVGVANQTTMLMTETMKVGEEIRKAMEERYGRENLAEHFELFDTICSATQDRQDALMRLLEHPLDVMVIVGGYNSSNTNNLAIIAAERVPRSYHIASGVCIRGDSIRHKPPGTPLDPREEIEEEGWLPEGPVRVGLTAGASTPNSQIGLAVRRILEARGIPVEEALAAPS
ncbi:4-hydroxy-3-methylbut-2-enyl diphosphate reductase [Rubrobacter xylanophilus DSM 9941]|uniref:4-hydroxy-3-methylbut-2-enyl diphosphate reductase n=1 Tax=Rubrobacter xylanophilus TaxID=49319 RepID=UPI001C643415|nr:4-hydroxy-3-methylbut-2-enyl diphosphate reductase [Rubrobacter xylanophilus]QYJ15373.1 4-hydroxy-3-methylbut-2-enyl diphosphate reductase [Rubrobacter xylanophilus DSM 9941]